MHVKIWLIKKSLVEKGPVVKSFVDADIHLLLVLFFFFCFFYNLGWLLFSFRDNFLILQVIVSLYDFYAIRH